MKLQTIKIELKLRKTPSKIKISHKNLTNFRSNAPESAAQVEITNTMKQQATKNIDMGILTRVKER